MVDFPGVFTCRGVSRNGLEAGVVCPFIGGADTGGSLLPSKFKNKTKDITLTTRINTKARESWNVTMNKTVTVGVLR